MKDGAKTGAGAAKTGAGSGTGAAKYEACERPTRQAMTIAICEYILLVCCCFGCYYLLKLIIAILVCAFVS